jgi:hypothetical protein
MVAQLAVIHMQELGNKSIQSLSDATHPHGLQAAVTVVTSLT